MLNGMVMLMMHVHFFLPYKCQAVSCEQWSAAEGSEADDAMSILCYPLKIKVGELCIVKCCRG